MEGMLNLAALLKRSQSMLVCWDPSYVLRMWCSVELAAFLKSHPEGPLVIRPTSWGACVIVAFLSLATLLVGPEILTNNLVREEGAWRDLVASFVFTASVIVFMCFTSAVARAHFRAAATVQDQLRTFSFENDTLCHCCTVHHVDKHGQKLLCDKQTISGCLEHWFGSVADFDVVVQKQVSASFGSRVSLNCLLPYSWLTATTIPMLWFGIHLGIDFRFRYSDSWMAFYNWFYCVGWWLGVIPLLVALWLRVMRRCKRRRAGACQEVMLNVACSCLFGLMVLTARGIETLVVTSVPTYGVLVCTIFSLTAAALALGDCGRLFSRKSPQTAS